MLNPNDIANKKFEKSMGRYKIEEVEQYLAQLSAEVGGLLDEKNALEQKMLVLADKLEEYKNDEGSLRSALLGAQKLGDSVVRDSKAKAANIIEDANYQAGTMVENAKRSIEREQAAFVRMQREVATFKSRLQLAYKQHLELISSIPVDNGSYGAPPKADAPQQEPAAENLAAETEPFSPAPAPEQELPEFDISLPDVGADVYTEELLAYTETDESYPIEPEAEQDAEQPQKRESRFGPLKFGKEFDIKRDDQKRKK